MACELVGGPRWQPSQQDEEGFRTYPIKFRVRSGEDDGPANVLQTPGLPLPGSIWNWLDDIDVWAYFTNQMSVEPITQVKCVDWDVTCYATTKPRSKQCRDARFEDPLLEPPKVSGGFVKYTEERTTNADGTPIQNSSKEPLRGPLVEFDKSRNTVRIEQNVLLLQLDLLTQMNDTLNDAPLWGLPARYIKLSVGPWEVKYYGSCYKYYTRSFEFEANVKYDETTGLYSSGWDRIALDEGTKVLRGSWNRDPVSLTFGHWIVASGVTGSKPSDYMRYKDWNGELANVILDGAGKPVFDDGGTGSDVTSPGSIAITGYRTSNFLLLGIPTVL